MCLSLRTGRSRRRLPSSRTNLCLSVYTAHAELKQAEQHRQKPADASAILLEEQRWSYIIAADEHMMTFVPFFARFPYEVHIYPRRHVGTIADLDEAERSALACSIQTLVRRYDALFDKPMPYMMAMHQRPTDGGTYEHFHYHIEFLPLARTATKLKYLAGSESGAGAFITDMSAEKQAADLKEVTF